MQGGIEPQARPRSRSTGSRNTGGACRPEIGVADQGRVYVGEFHDEQQAPPRSARRWRSPVRQERVQHRQAARAQHVAGAAALQPHGAAADHAVQDHVLAAGLGRVRGHDAVHRVMVDPRRSPSGRQACTTSGRPARPRSSSAHDRELTTALAERPFVAAWVPAAVATRLIVFGRGLVADPAGFRLTRQSSERVDALVGYVRQNAAAFAARRGRIVFSGGWAGAAEGFGRPPPRCREEQPDAGPRYGDGGRHRRHEPGNLLRADTFREIESDSTLENVLRIKEGTVTSTARPLLAKRNPFSAW